MRKQLHQLWPIVLVAALAGIGRAASPATAPALSFLKPDAVNVRMLLPPPPRAGTQEAAEELETVLRMQEKRTPAEIERAKAENKMNLSAFAPVVGAWFTEENLPLTAKLIKQAEVDAKVFTSAGKRIFERSRPFADPRVKAVLTEDSASYPSGHAARGVVYAWVIAQLDPALTDALMARGYEIGWDRVIAGVHYPSDLTAGRMVGHAVTQAFAASPEFARALEGARDEYAAAKRKAAATQPVGVKAAQP